MIRPGEIYAADFPLAGRHPVIVVSREDLNRGSYALVVGISQYKNLPPEGQLKFPERDAASIYTVLISAEGGQFEPANVHKLIGAQATLANLRRELEQWLPSVTKDDDRVLIYFAGHGFVSSGKAYLAPYDIDPLKIGATAYPMEALGSQFGAKIHGKWKVLLTDAFNELERVQERYEQIKALTGVWREVRKARKKHGKEKGGETRASA